MELLTDMAAKRAELTPDAIAFVDHETGRSFSFFEILLQNRTDFPHF